MRTHRLVGLVDRLGLLAAVTLPLAALLALLIGILAADRLGGPALLLPVAALLALLVACDAAAVREPNRAEALHRLNRLSLHPLEEELFARVLRDPNPQRIAAAAFGPGLLRFAALLAWLCAAAAAVLTLVALFPHLAPGLAPFAALLLAVVAFARVHDAIASRALAHLVPAAASRIVTTATAISEARLERISAGVLRARSGQG